MSMNFPAPPTTAANRFPTMPAPAQFAAFPAPPAAAHASTPSAAFPRPATSFPAPPANNLANTSLSRFPQPPAFTPPATLTNPTPAPTLGSFPALPNSFPTPPSLASATPLKPFPAFPAAPATPANPLLAQRPAPFTAPQSSPVPGSLPTSGITGNAFAPTPAGNSFGRPSALPASTSAPSATGVVANAMQFPQRPQMTPSATGPVQALSNHSAFPPAPLASSAFPSTPARPASSSGPTPFPTPLPVPNAAAAPAFPQPASSAQLNGSILPASRAPAPTPFPTPLPIPTAATPGNAAGLNQAQQFRPSSALPGPGLSSVPQPAPVQSALNPLPPFHQPAGSIPPLALNNVPNPALTPNFPPGGVPLQQAQQQMQSDPYSARSQSNVPQAAAANYDPYGSGAYAGNPANISQLQNRANFGASPPAADGYQYQQSPVAQLAQSAAYADPSLGPTPPPRTYAGAGAGAGAMAPPVNGNGGGGYYDGNGSNDSNNSERGTFQPPRPKKVERIDPKQIPRPIEHKSTGAGVIKYFTRSGQSPPPATADYCCIDEGNCSPRFLRLTTNNIAADHELIENTKLCIGAVIQPLASLVEGEEQIPVIHYQNGPVRCTRCAAYVNPFFQFVDQGARFVCNICGTKNECPDDYRCNLDPNGLRRDKDQRPELSRGSVEFIVGKEFIGRPITDPTFLFVVDVSYTAVVSGLVEIVVESLRTTVQQMEGHPRIRIGIITYDETVHFYSIRSGASEPQMLIVTDIEDSFVPCPPEEVLVEVRDADKVKQLFKVIDLIASMFSRGKVRENQSAVGAAAVAASETLKDFGGKVLLIQSNLPQIGGGSLQNRENANLYNTDKERTLMAPQISFFHTLGTKCAESAITVDLFLAANCYIDLATIGALCEKTAGQIFSYPGFNAKKDGLALQSDLQHDVQRLTGFDGVMVVRCSTGLRVAEYYGNFYHRRVNEMDLPTIDCDKAFGVRLEHEGKLKDKSEACIQCALLYTTPNGDRRIRVHTLSVPVTSVMANIFRHSDLDAIINLSLKQAVRQLMDQTTCDEAQQALSNACIDSLFTYRKFCASSTSAGQLILPEPLKLLPLCTLALIKHPLFQDGTIAADERAFLYQYVTSMPAYVSVAFVCPRLFSLLDIPAHACVPDKDGRVCLPSCLTLSSESVASDNLYILDDSRHLFLFIGAEVNKATLEDIFELKSPESSSSSLSTKGNTSYDFRLTEDPLFISNRMSVLVETLRKHKPAYQSLQLISRRGLNDTGLESLDESLFFSHLIEDAVTGRKVSKKESDGKGKNPNTMSYIDFLCWIHKKIQNKFY